MTPHTPHGAEDGVFAAILGWVSAFAGQIALFGVEIFKAAILGFVGAIAGMFARWIWKKHIVKGEKK